MIQVTPDWLTTNMVWRTIEPQKQLRSWQRFIIIYRDGVDLEEKSQLSSKQINTTDYFWL